MKHFSNRIRNLNNRWAHNDPQRFIAKLARGGMMNIDQLISSFDFDKVKGDCLIHDYLKIYVKKKSNLAANKKKATGKPEAQLKEYSDTLKQLLECAMCFPSGCENCAGMQKCIDCVSQDNLASAFVKLNRYMENSE